MRIAAALAVVVVPTCCAVACGVFGSDNASSSGPDGGEGEAAAPREGGASVPSRPASDLVIGLPFPRDIVIDSSDVYWICEPQGGAGGIWTVPKRPNPGPAAVFLDGGELFYKGAASAALAGDTGALYWAAGPIGSRKAKAGGPVMGLFWLGESGGDGVCQGLTIEPGKIYVATTGHGGQILANDTDTPPDSAFSLEPSLGADVKVLTVDLTDVYVGRPGQILKVPKGGSDASSPIVFATTDGAVHAIVNDSSTVYWVDTSRVRSLEKTKIGGLPTDIAIGQYNPSAIALDEANIYWTNEGDGFVRTVPKAGGAPKTLSMGEGRPRAIAVDATGVFWTNYDDGRVRVIWR